MGYDTNQICPYLQYQQQILDSTTHVARYKSECCVSADNDRWGALHGIDRVLRFTSFYSDHIRTQQVQMCCVPGIGYNLQFIHNSFQRKSWCLKSIILCSNLCSV